MCLMQDTHGLFKDPQEHIAALQDTNAKLVENMAGLLIWRKDAATMLRQLRVRIEALEESHAESEAIRDTLADREALLREVRAAVAGMPERQAALEAGHKSLGAKTDLIDAYVEEIEIRLGLKRSVKPSRTKRRQQPQK